MKEHRKLYQKQVSKVTLHFVWGHFSRKQIVREHALILELGEEGQSKDQVIEISRNYFSGYLEPTLESTVSSLTLIMVKDQRHQIIFSSFSVCGDRKINNINNHCSHYCKYNYSPVLEGKMFSNYFCLVTAITFLLACNFNNS